jgi:Putative auto-transporter adhesin, head GIN domain
MGNNMNTIKIILLFLIALLLFNGCDNKSTINNSDTIYGSGVIATKTANVADCSGVTINAAGNVYLTQDSVESIRIEADDNIINNVIAREENGILVTGLPSGSYSNITLRIYVSIKTITQASIVGAGNITLRNPLTADNLNCSIDGAGYIYITGTGNYLNCLINGAGTIDAKDFAVSKCKAAVNGAGTCTVYTTNELDASINGAGVIYYYGNPSNVKTSILGIGQIIKK